MKTNAPGVLHGPPVFLVTAGCALLHAAAAPIAKADAFSWLGGGGEFSSPGNWRDFKNQSFDPPIANPLNRVPGAADIVAFPQDQGAYTVQIADATVLGTAIFDTFTGSVVTLNVAGTYNLGESQLANIRITGGGTARSSKILIYDSVLSGVRAEFSNLEIDHESPPGGAALTVRDQAALVSGGPLVFTGEALLDNGSWTHMGLMPGGEVRVVNGGALTVREASAADGPSTPGRLRAESGGAVDMDNVRTRADASGGGTVTFKRAELFTDPAFLNPSVFSGGGTTLTVTEELKVTGGVMRFAAGGGLRTPLLTGGFAVEAVDSGSAVDVTGLLDTGTVSAKNGGSAAVAVAKNATLEAVGAGSALTFNTVNGETGKNVTLNASSGGVLSGGSVLAGLGQGGGTIRNAGSRLTLTGNLEIGGVNLRVEDGGRVDCALAAFGGGTFADATVTGANSFFMPRSGLILGDRAGSATLTVSDSGRLEMGGGSVAIGLGGGADARVFVNVGGVLDARRSDELGIGISAKGQLTVNSAGRVLATDLTLGALAGGDGAFTGTGAGGSLETGGTLQIGGAGLGRVTLQNQFIAETRVVNVGDSPADNILTITGGAELRFADAIFSGHAGRGTVRVTAGGVITGTGAAGRPRIGIGGDEDSVGTGVLEITGAGSRVNGTVNGLMLVGSTGGGTLSTTGGGVLDTGIASIGAAQGSSGAATVTGSGSRWNVAEILDVGGFLGAVPGTLTAGDGGTVRVGERMKVTSAGVVTLSGGSVSVGSGEAAVGTLRVGAGGRLRLGGRVTGGKVIIGIGGVFESGNSPGVARLESGFEMESGAALELEIAGAEAGVLYDQVMVTGAAALNGALTVRFTNGFAPAAGQTFDLISAGSLTGAFSGVTVEGLAPGFQHQITTSPDGHLRLTAQTAGGAATPPAAAELTVESLYGLVALSYPPELKGWELQSSPDLSSGSWTPLEAPGHRLTLRREPARRFFRLVQS